MSMEICWNDTDRIKLR